MPTNPQGTEQKAVELELGARVEAERKRLGLSQRALGQQTGVAFSTLCRVARGEGEFDEGSARKLKIWLGDDIADLENPEAEAVKLGRLMAVSVSGEIMRIIAARPLDTRVAGLVSALELARVFAWNKLRGEMDPRQHDLIKTIDEALASFNEGGTVDGEN